ncbi:DUF637 domain-containing protein [Moraxella catarrhalis]|uniref:DUF637 domain-containing protein n=1 Tax=Moraxella catarrhalis TaxID=480 RepID=UPI001D12CC15|nr:DUF637 domain-containing protein [Moraxella catarrhalis]
MDFTALRLAQENWDYKEEGLTAGGAAMLAIALSVATAGGGVASLSSVGISVTAGSATATMANAAFTSLVTQAGTTLVNNKGDVNKTLKDLGKSQTAKNMAKAVLTAGVAANLDKFLGQTLKIDTSATATIGDKFTRAFVQGTGLALTDSLIYGESLEESLKRHLTNQLVDTAATGLYTYGVKPLDINDAAFMSNIAHKLAAGLTGCLSAQATDNACESGAIGAVVGEMWGDYHNTLDPSHPNYQNQKDKLISQAKLIAGITAAYAGEDVNVAAGVAAEAVENNSLRAVVQTVKIAGKLVKVAVKNGKVTIKDLKDVLRKEGFDIVDGLITLTDGQLTFDDAKAIIDLVVGTNLNNRQEKIDMIVKKKEV